MVLGRYIKCEPCSIALFAISTGCFKITSLEKYNQNVHISKVILNGFYGLIFGTNYTIHVGDLFGSPCAMSHNAKLSYLEGLA